MKKHEFYPGYHDRFEYFGSNEIARIRIRKGRAIRHDWLVFDTAADALLFFCEKCGERGEPAPGSVYLSMPAMAGMDRPSNGVVWRKPPCDIT